MLSFCTNYLLLCKSYPKTHWLEKYSYLRSSLASGSGSEPVMVSLSRCQLGLCLIWRLPWGWGTCFQDGTHMWLLAGGLSSLPHGLAMELLEYLHNMATVFPWSDISQRKKGKEGTGMSSVSWSWMSSTIPFTTLSSFKVDCQVQLHTQGKAELSSTSWRGVSKNLWTYFNTTILCHQIKNCTFMFQL